MLFVTCANEPSILFWGSDTTRKYSRNIKFRQYRKKSHMMWSHVNGDGITKRRIKQKKFCAYIYTQQNGKKTNHLKSSPILRLHRILCYHISLYFDMWSNLLRKLHPVASIFIHKLYQRLSAVYTGFFWAKNIMRRKFSFCFDDDHETMTPTSEMQRNCITSVAILKYKIINHTNPCCLRTDENCSSTWLTRKNNVGT